MSGLTKQHHKQKQVLASDGRDGIGKSGERECNAHLEGGHWNRQVACGLFLAQKGRKARLNQSRLVVLMYE